MSNVRAFFLCLLAFTGAGIAEAQNPTAAPVRVTSPNGEIVFILTDPGADVHPQYAVEFHGKRLMEAADLGLKLVGQPELGAGMRLKSTQADRADETYTIPVGKTSRVRNHYNGVRADFEDASGRRLTIEARAFDDGVAFRYVVPEQPSLKKVRIASELTEFVFAKDAETYPLVLDGYQSSWEDEYQLRNVSGLHSDWLIGLPFLAHEAGLGWIGITEADIENYSGMYLRKSAKFASLRLHADLSPHADREGAIDSSYAVETSTPFSSPWRLLMIGDEPGKLIESNIVLNLNPPSKIADPSWIKAGKSAWDWWSGDAAPGMDFKTGVNTATMKWKVFW